jgi:hypothetical protein
MDVPFPKRLCDQIALFELLMDQDLMKFPFIIDKCGLFGSYLKQKYQAKLKVEICTPNENTKKIVEDALKEGEILYLEDPDSRMLNLLAPIF